ncbi:MAG: protease complex subunit PrcB family protein [Dysgonamonadaceae bacterium]|jgi:hypothetical protein|nr:protease complex subunit PrcB family protein [Dysgonamonadaceae bacterium]
MKKIKFILFLLSVIFFGCDKEESGPFVPIDISKGRSNDIGIIEFRNKMMVITTQQEWEELKSQLRKHRINDDNIAVAQPDFSIEQIVVVFGEIYDNGGWTIDITDVKEYADSIVVFVQNLNKGNSTSVVTQPYHLVKIPVSDKKVTFQLTDLTFYQNVETTVFCSLYACMPHFDGSVSSGLYIINSQEELVESLLKYLSCGETETCLVVDFGKYSLLLVRGFHTSTLCGHTSELIQISDNEFRIDVNVWQSMAAQPDFWYVAKLIPKLPQNAKIKLNQHVFLLNS